APLRAATPRVSDFSYVLIDCPPSLNLLTVNALAAADAILVPLQCEFFALEGLSQLLQTVATVKSTLNPELMIHGIVLTMHDARNNLSNQVVADVRANSKQKVYDTIIPRNVRVSEAPSYGKPVLVYDLKCVGSEAYLRLATEIIQREKELIANAPRADAAIESGQIESDQQHGAAGRRKVRRHGNGRCRPIATGTRSCRAHGRRQRRSDDDARTCAHSTPRPDRISQAQSAQSSPQLFRRRAR